MLALAVLVLNLGLAQVWTDGGGGGGQRRLRGGRDLHEVGERLGEGEEGGMGRVHGSVDGEVWEQRGVGEGSRGCSLKTISKGLVRGFSKLPI